ncbi:sensor histidine kinase [Candidatus Binatus sp.]|uniref:sensor histidine kinase n=1 Tax=Candidatus Binatus sp. TaxID=2811406 RepID=UPI003CC550E1
MLNGPRNDVPTLINMTENNPSKNLWALSSLASTIGAGDFAVEDHDSFRRQEFVFAALNLLLIGALFALQAISRFVRGRPSESVIIVLTAGFVIQAAYFIWVRARNAEISEGTRRFLTYWSLGFNSILALVLTTLTLRGDTAYYALMLLPILEASFRLGLGVTIGVIVLADFICFVGAYGLKFGEYIEAGAMTVIYSVMGVLVWLLVNNLRTREARFAHNLEELERTRQQLLSEEKLAAIGRLSRAIAHEIRNPVAMISSSLATATRPGQDESEREEMFSIAAKEAQRLERLTTDFLVYARPRPVQVALVNVADTLNYVATVARAHAANEGVAIDVAVDSNLEGEFDANQMHQALLNLVLNAIDACHRGDQVKLDAHTNGNGSIRIDVVDPAGPIPPEIVPNIFEPLFTTKQGGSGLGLSIARNIARAHGSDIVLRINEPRRVCFSIEIPKHATNQSDG